jgi:hypothetical protein
MVAKSFSSNLDDLMIVEFGHAFVHPQIVLRQWKVLNFVDYKNDGYFGC